MSDGIPGDGIDTMSDDHDALTFHTLPTAAQARKAIPIATGFIDYFPQAIAAVAELSRIGNEQHNPGKPLHWDRSKSGDESDAMMRHFVERGTIDTDRVRHSTKVAWRAMALLEKELEAATNRPSAPSVLPIAWVPGMQDRRQGDRRDRGLFA